MKKLIIISLILFTSCMCTKQSKDEQIKNLQVQIDSLKLEIIDNLDVIKSLKEEVRMSRMEADYWGYKHDSILISFESKNK